MSRSHQHQARPGAPPKPSPPSSDWRQWKPEDEVPDFDDDDNDVRPKASTTSNKGGGAKPAARTMRKLPFQFDRKFFMTVILVAIIAYLGISWWNGRHTTFQPADVFGLRPTAAARGNAPSPKCPAGATEWRECHGDTCGAWRPCTYVH